LSVGLHHKVDWFTLVGQTEWL